MKILVIGGTGTVGGEVARRLVARGEQVRVPVRSPERAAAAPHGADAVPGDLRDPAGLGPAFAGADAVFLANALAQDETAQGLAAVEAAARASARKLVYMSVHRIDEAPEVPHFSSKLPVERAVRESGIPYTILRPNNFFQNDLGLRHAITEYGVYPAPAGNLGMHRVDVRDIAEMAVKALTEPGHDGAIYAAVGSDALTGVQIAETWARHLGRDVRYGGDDLQAWAAQVRGLMPEWLIEDLCIMYEHFQKHGFLATEQELARAAEVLGHAPRSFDAFAAETSDAWRRGAASEAGQR